MNSTLSLFYMIQIILTIPFIGLILDKDIRDDYLRSYYLGVRDITGTGIKKNTNLLRLRHRYQCCAYTDGLQAGIEIWCRVQWDIKKRKRGL